LVFILHFKKITKKKKKQWKKQTLNNDNELNVTLGSMHLQYSAQHEKNSDFFYYTHIMIIVINIFLTQQFQNDVPNSY